MSVDSLADAASNLLSLRLGRSGTVIGSVEDSDPFMNSLYVPDAVDQEVTEFLDSTDPGGELYILLGSSGDGKTAIFGRAYRESTASWLEPQHLKLDATESTNPTRSKAEQLSSFLETTIDDIGESGAPRKGLAINLGLALNFFRRQEYKDAFPEVWAAIDSARDPDNFDRDCIYNPQGDIRVANLSHRRLFSTHPDTLGAGLLEDIISRFDYTNEQSPFVSISDQIESTRTENPIAYNLYQLSDDVVRRRLVEILASRAILTNEYLNPRRVLDSLSRILLPAPVATAIEDTDLESDDDLPTFAQISDNNSGIVDSGAERTVIWNEIYYTLTDYDDISSRLDPCTVFSLAFDRDILALLGDRLDASTDSELPYAEHLDRLAVARTRVRRDHLHEEATYMTEEKRDSFERFLAARTVLDGLIDSYGEGLPDRRASEAHDTLENAIKRWSGQEVEEEMVQVLDGQDAIETRFFAEWNMAGLDTNDSAVRTTEETQLGKVWFVFENEAQVPLSYPLYRMFALINQGYNPDAVNSQQSEGVRLLHSQFAQFTDKRQRLEVRGIGNTLKFEVERLQFGSGIEITQP